jgi:hypothetical protein
MAESFISYARAGLDVVQRLEQVLVANGIAVWRDQKSIRGGEQWPKAIGEAISATDCLILVWSKHAAQSHFVEFEWNTAIALRKTILPCLFDETRLPAALSAINAVDGRQLDDTLPKILDALEKAAPAAEPAHNSAVIAQLGSLNVTKI